MRNFVQSRKGVAFRDTLLALRIIQGQPGAEETVRNADEGITEALKASDPMQWVQRMNSIRDRAEEILREELIYV